VSQDEMTSATPVENQAITPAGSMQSLPANSSVSTTQSAKGTQHSPDEFYWEWGLHEDHMYTNRTNYVLVAEAMLFAAMAQLRASSEVRASAALRVIYGLGVFVTLIWLSVNHRQLQHTDKLIVEKIKEHVPLWKAVDDRRPRTFFRIRMLTGYLLPIVLLMAWIVLWVV
jgi:hypothetical protein